MQDICGIMRKILNLRRKCELKKYPTYDAKTLMYNFVEINFYMIEKVKNFYIIEKVKNFTRNKIFSTFFSVNEVLLKRIILVFAISYFLLSEPLSVKGKKCFRGIS